MFSSLGMREFKAYKIEGEAVTQIELSRAVLDRIQVLPDIKTLERILIELSCSEEKPSGNTLFVLEYWDARYLSASQELIPKLKWKGQRASALC